MFSPYRNITVCKMKVTVSLKVILFFVFVFGAFHYSHSQGVCNTPDNTVGQCISVFECKTIIDVIQNSPKPIPQELAKKLYEYSCGYEETGARVCCPSEPIVIGRTAETTPPPPASVAGHKNLPLLPEDCGYIDIVNKIRNGEDAELFEFPWMALLAYNTSKGPQFKCGGSIINERYILTAAHCLVGTPYPLVSVRIGEYDLSLEKDCADGKCLPPYQDLSLEKVLYHPDYNVTLYANDIGLIRVPKMNLTGTLTSICLPVDENIRDKPFERVVVTGWGFTDAAGRTSADILQRVDLNLRNLSTCIDAYKIIPQVKLSYKQLCVGGTDQKDSCGGDSGGPLQVAVHLNGESRYVQQGIVSVGHAYCGTEGFPGVYTRVPYYLKWILDSIKP